MIDLEVVSSWLAEEEGGDFYRKAEADIAIEQARAEGRQQAVLYRAILKEAEDRIRVLIADVPSWKPSHYEATDWLRELADRMAGLNATSGATSSASASEPRSPEVVIRVSSSPELLGIVRAREIQRDIQRLIDRNWGSGVTVAIVGDASESGQSPDVERLAWAVVADGNNDPPVWDLLGEPVRNMARIRARHIIEAYRAAPPLPEPSDD